LKYISWIVTDAKNHWDSNLLKNDYFQEQTLVKKMPLYLTYEQAYIYRNSVFGCAIHNDLGDLDKVIFTSEKIQALYPPHDISLIVNDDQYWCR
jgi:hypothetical protein